MCETSCEYLICALKAIEQLHMEIRLACSMLDEK